MTRQKSLKKKVITSFYWLTGVTWLGQIFSWALTLIVIRLLTPDDYGLFAMATVLTGFLTILSELGLGAAIIQKNEIAEDELRKIFGCVIVLDFFLCGAVWGTAPLVANFFAEPRVIPVMRLLCFNFILISFYLLPQSLLQRDLNYKRISVIDLIATVCSSAVTLLLAWKNYGAFALVWGIVCIHLVKAVIYNFDKSLRYCPAFSLRGIRSMLRFGGYISFSRVIWYFYSQADVVIVGRVFGKGQLGVYSIALQLVSIPLTKIGSIAHQIGLPAFSQIQDNLSAVQKNFLKIVKVSSLLSFPLYLGAASVVDVVLPALLGDKWIESIVFIQILCLVMPLRFISTFFTPVVSAVGRPDIHAGNMIIAIIIMPVAFLVGSRWGPLGLCLAWIVAFPIFFLISAGRVLKVLQLPLRVFLKEFYLPAGASVGMAISIFWMKNTGIMELPPLLSIIILCCSGVAVYSTAVLAIDREVVSEMKLLFSAK
ncbi:MAG: lipopolysaccharide biosynthesis protein [Desulfobacteraceae bacterium]|nr:lipopolysaccharide biosynthesis protein [Desulfobacteraceae bacterium]MBC2754838.1 lipopolysaccharide biosynthesis protein [Desulfobacteraceae bacterium]